LPAPPQGDVEFALARAGRAGTPQGDVDYAKQMAFGRQLATAVTKAWEKLETQQAEALRVSQLKDARIVELTKEVEAVRKEGSRNLWSMAGVAVAVAGALAFAFTGPRIGLPLMACGAAMGAFPFVVESPHWDLIVTVTLSLGACLLIWVAWDYARDRVNKSDQPPQE
jgi:hypothetical protein